MGGGTGGYVLYIQDNKFTGTIDNVKIDLTEEKPK